MMWKDDDRSARRPAERNPRALRLRAPRPGRYRRGGALLEAALVLPVLLSVAFGTVEFGHFFFVKNTLQGAAREGARAAIVSGTTNADVTAAVNQQLTMAGLDTGQYTVTTSPATVASATAGTSIGVTVSATWGSVGVRPMGMISSNKLVAGACVMRRE